MFQLWERSTLLSSAVIRSEQMLWITLGKIMLILRISIGCERTSTVFSSAWGEGEPTIPMRRGFFTGMRSYPWRFHIDDRGSVPNIYGWHAIPTAQTTLAEHLLLNGVATGLVADVYHMFKPTMNFTRGFMSYDYIRGQESDRVRSGPLSSPSI